MRYWHEVKRFKQEQFDVVVDWTYEDATLDQMFDETCHDIQEMADRCNRGVDTHYIARVTFMYDGVEMGSATIGSCYAYDCDPSDDIESGLDGYLADMMEEAESEARERAVDMLDRLKADFLGEHNAA